MVAESVPVCAQRERRSADFLEEQAADADTARGIEKAVRMGEDTGASGCKARCTHMGHAAFAHAEDTMRNVRRSDRVQVRA